MGKSSRKCGFGLREIREKRPTPQAKSLPESKKNATRKVLKIQQLHIK